MSILLGNFLIGVGTILHSVVWLAQFLMIARAVLSWVSPDPYNPLVQFIHGTTEPILYHIRRYVPPLGMLDMSVLVALLGLYFLDIFLVQSIVEVGARLKLGVLS